MKNAFVLAFVLALVLAGCAPKAERSSLETGTPAYALAQDLAKIMPALGPDRTTVVVEAKGVTVTAAEVIQAIRDNRGNQTDQLKTADAGQIKSLIERGAVQLGERKLLLAAAGEAKTAVPAEALDKAMQSEYARAGGEQAFLDALKRADISIDHVRKNIQETLVINAFLEGVVAAGATVTEAELRKAYKDEAASDKTATVRHILLLTQGKNDQEKAEARKRIEDILARARAGEDFAALAKQYSEDPGSKDNGGLYEDFGRGQMVKPFEDASFSVPVGGISGVVETDYGYHIIKVIDRKRETQPFEAVRGELEARLKRSKENTLVADFVKQLKDKAKFKLIGL